MAESKKPREAPTKRCTHIDAKNGNFESKPKNLGRRMKSEAAGGEVGEKETPLSLGIGRDLS